MNDEHILGRVTSNAPLPTNLRIEVRRAATDAVIATAHVGRDGRFAIAIRARFRSHVLCYFCVIDGADHVLQSGSAFASAVRQ